MVNRRALIGLVLFSAAGAFAFLPPDAELRKSQLLSHAAKVRKKYDERIEERRELATRQFEQATADIGVPPWELKRRMNGGGNKTIHVEVKQEQAVKRENKKQFLVSIMLLLIIGSVVGWVKHKTREVEL